MRTIWCRMDIPFVQKRLLQTNRTTVRTRLGFWTYSSSFSCSWIGSKFSRSVSPELLFDIFVGILAREMGHYMMDGGFDGGCQERESRVGLTSSKHNLLPGNILVQTIGKVSTQTAMFVSCELT